MAAGKRVCSYDAERVALSEGVRDVGTIASVDRFVRGHDKKKVVTLITDSLSNIHRLRSCKPKTSKEVELFFAVGSLAQHVDLRIAHVRGHANIRLNEEADKLAELGALAQVVTEDSGCRVLTTDQLKKELRLELGNLRESNLESACRGDFSTCSYTWYNAVKPCLRKGYSVCKLNLSRKMQAAVTQLELGLMPTALGYKTDRGTDRCMQCGCGISKAVPAWHFLFECEKTSLNKVGEYPLRNNLSPASVFHGVPSVCTPVIMTHLMDLVKQAKKSADVIGNSVNTVVSGVSVY